MTRLNPYFPVIMLYISSTDSSDLSATSASDFNHCRFLSMVQQLRPVLDDMIELRLFSLLCTLNAQIRVRSAPLRRPVGYPARWRGSTIPPLDRPTLPRSRPPRAAQGGANGAAAGRKPTRRPHTPRIPHFPPAPPPRSRSASPVFAPLAAGPCAG